MIKVPVTHEWNRLLYIVKIFTLLLMLGLVADVSGRIFNGVHLHWVISLLGLVIVFLVSVIASHFLIWQYIDVLSTYLYVRRTLKTKLSFSDAKALRPLFELNASGKWYPMTGVLDLPEEQRLPTLMAVLQQLR